MNVFSHFESIILDAVKQLQADGVVSDDMVWKGVSIEAPRDKSHGDIATNVAMVLKRFSDFKNPRDLAQKIIEKLESQEEIDKVEIAGPGFINLSIGNAFWHKIISAVLANPKDYGRSTLGAQEKVNLEFVSANPTGPMHVGHCRGAIFGDALAKVLDFAGFDVTKEYYINDAGNQVKVLARSAYLRYQEAAGREITIPEGLYPGDYLKPVGLALFEKYGDQFLDKDESAWIDGFKDFSIDAMMDMIRDDLKALNIEFDVYFSERSLIQGDKDIVRETIENLRSRGIVEEGVLPPPKGKLLEDWDEREQTLFKATDYGDDVDRALVKSDGTYTYFASDMAYHQNKFDRGFHKMIDVWGADHSGYIKRMKAAVTALSHDKGVLDVKICQLVNLFRNGQPFKMSKRAGTFVTLREVVDEVGKDVVRFMMLYRKNDAPLDFDFAKVIEQKKENPVFYVQYAYARTQSVLFRKLPEILPDMSFDKIDLSKVNLSLLDDEAEINLMKRLAQYGKTIESAALTHEPHRIAFYLNKLASDFHSLYNKGTDIPHLRFIFEDNIELTAARLCMVNATAIVIASGLEILGVEPVEEMR